MSHDELLELARAQYGELIVRAIRWPDGRVTVDLIGGERVFYLPDGRRVARRPSLRVRVWELLARARGTAAGRRG